MTLVNVFYCREETWPGEGVCLIKSLLLGGDGRYTQRSKVPVMDGMVNNSSVILSDRPLERGQRGGGRGIGEDHILVILTIYRVESNLQHTTVQQDPSCHVE